MAGTHSQEWHSQEWVSDWFSKASELTEATMKAAAQVQLASLDRLMEGLADWRSIFADSHGQNEQNHHGKHSIAQNNQHQHRLWQQGLDWAESPKNASKKKSSQPSKANQQNKMNQQGKVNQQSKAKKSSRSHAKGKNKG